LNDLLLLVGYYLSDDELDLWVLDICIDDCVNSNGFCIS